MLTLSAGYVLKPFQTGAFRRRAHHIEHVGRYTLAPLDIYADPEKCVATPNVGNAHPGAMAN